MRCELALLVIHVEGEPDRRQTHFPDLQNRSFLHSEYKFIISFNIVARKLRTVRQKRPISFRKFGSRMDFWNSWRPDTKPLDLSIRGETMRN